MQPERVLEQPVRKPRKRLPAMLAGSACAMLLPIVANAAQVTFRWDYAASGAAGFMLYCGPPGGSYTAIVDVGNTDTYTLAGLGAGRIYECAVTAYDTMRSESEYSAPLRLYLAFTGRCTKACDGDLNQDGSINALDLGILKQSWGSDDSSTDFNGDGVVNFTDLGIFRALQ